MCGLYLSPIVIRTLKLIYYILVLEQSGKEILYEFNLKLFSFLLQ